MNRFENNSVIYWSPATAAHPVAGGILDQWSQAGYEASSYGYPAQDEVSHAGVARSQDFQHGTIFFPKRAAAESIHNDFLHGPGQSQCGIPQAQRVGAWACEAPVESQALTSPDEQQRQGFSEYCGGDFGGCWRVYNDFKADYEVRLFFGSSTRLLGTGQAVVTWQLEGPHTNITNAWIKSDDLVIKTAWFSGALFNGAVGAENGVLNRPGESGDLWI